MRLEESLTSTACEGTQTTARAWLLGDRDSSSNNVQHTSSGHALIVVYKSSHAATIACLDASWLYPEHNTTIWDVS